LELTLRDVRRQGRRCCVIIQVVNRFHSDQPVYYQRWLTPLLQAACETHPIVVLTGARQVGKSTLLQRAEPFCHWRYHTMDDFNALIQAREHPASLWAGAHELN
jgi:hypothetical protein